MKKILIAIISLLSTVCYAEQTPAWQDIPLVPGIFSIQAANAEIGEFGDVISRRGYSLVDTNLFRIGKALDVKIGVSAFDQSSPSLVFGIGESLVNILMEVSVLGVPIALKADPLKNADVSLLTGYNPQNQTYSLGLAITQSIPIPSPL